MVGPIRLRSNQEIVFEKVVEVVARKGAFKRRSDCLFLARKVSNLM